MPPRPPAPKPSPILIEHIEWVRAHLTESRNACEHREWHECQLRDITVYHGGQLDPVCLACRICETQLVLFKSNLKT